MFHNISWPIQHRKSVIPLFYFQLFHWLYFLVFEYTTLYYIVLLSVEKSCGKNVAKILHYQTKKREEGTERQQQY